MQFYSPIYHYLYKKIPVCLYISDSNHRRQQAQTWKWTFVDCICTVAPLSVNANIKSMRCIQRKLGNAEEIEKFHRLTAEEKKDDGNDVVKRFVSL